MKHKGSHTLIFSLTPQNSFYLSYFIFIIFFVHARIYYDNFPDARQAKSQFFFVYVQLLIRLPFCPILY